MCPRIWIGGGLLAILLGVRFAAAEPAWTTMQGEPEISIERFGLPEALSDAALLSALASRTGIADTRLGGLRLRIALPTRFRFESLHTGIADGVFLERDRSLLQSVGNFLLRLMRILLLGRLSGVSEQFEIPAAIWVGLIGEPFDASEKVVVQPSESIEIEAGDRELSHHGAFVVCRLIAATSPFTELIDIEIRGRDPRSGERLRYRIPRFVLPQARAQDASSAPTGAASALVAATEAP